jgi:hypothetical protein
MLIWINAMRSADGFVECLLLMLGVETASRRESSQGHPLMALRRFAPADIARLMAECGHSGKSIARNLNRTPQAIRVKCCELGIKLKPQSVANRRVRLPVPVWMKLKATADAYGMTVVKLAALLIETVVRDKLFDAVLDAPPAKSAARSPTKH